MRVGRSRSAGAAVLTLALTVALSAPIARAGDVPDKPPPPDLSDYSPWRPTPGDKLRDLCTDRPTKSTNACTVEPGRWQVESDLVNATFQRQDGVTGDLVLVTNPTVKLGLTDRIDLEATLAPFEYGRERDDPGGDVFEGASVGDLYLRSKIMLLGNGGADVAVAVVPYLKIPTAQRALGNGAVEGGVLAPVSLNLPAGFALNLDPELDIVKNAADSGRHVSHIELVSVSHPVGGGFTAAAELWTQFDFDPTGATTQASFDLGLSWIPKAAPNLQLDGGVNLGLNPDTPGAQVYLGVSRRF